MTTNDRLRREELYRGTGLLKQYAQDPIVICGAGALGSLLVDNLTRIGFTRLTVIDFDRVTTGNVSTQLYAIDDVGALKALSLRSTIFRNTGVEIEAINARLEAKNAKKLLKWASLVVDVFDNSESRQLVQDTCRAHRVKCLHGGLSGADGYGEITWDDVYTVPAGEQAGDPCEQPLARNLISIVVAILSEEIVNYMHGDPPRFQSWSFTLEDLAIRPRV